MAQWPPPPYASVCHIACWFRSGAVLKFDQF